VTTPTRTILVVDDDRDVQRFLAERLEREGWRVITEKDGDWALRSFERRQVDAVVLDILIPVVNGFQVAERIRATPQGRAVGIVMLTGIYRGPRHRAEAIERYGLIDYLDKPVDLERLVDLLRTHFTRTPAPPAAASPPPAPATPLAWETHKEEKREVERAAARVAEKPAAAEQRGNLKRTPFPRLLARLDRQRATGGLFLLRDKIKKIVYFRDGRATFIKSNVLDECLGRVLVRERMITESECEESVRRMKAQKRQQGSVLIEMGVISPHNLRYGLELQLGAKLFDVFAWTEGEFVFRGDVPLPQDVIGLDLSTAQVVLEGVRRAWTSDRLEAALAGLGEQHLAPAADPELRFQELDLAPAERIFVDALDGTRTVAEALLRAPAPLGRRGAGALVFALHATGVLEIAPERRAASPSFSLGGDGPAIFQADEARVAEWLAARRGADAFAILGVPAAATNEEIEREFGALARELHPDRFRGKPETAAALAREAFVLLVKAREELLDPRRRKQLEKARPRKPDSGLLSVEIPFDDTDPQRPSHDAATRALAADRLFQKGQERLRARVFGEAERAFRAAIAHREDVGLYHAYLGWTVFNARGMGRTAAREAAPILDRAQALAPGDEHAHLFRGMMHAALDEQAEAEAALERAIQSNPDSSDALRELRLLHMRRQRT
jgi:DNA-binding response OmpR family regulator